MRASIGVLFHGAAGRSSAWFGARNENPVYRFARSHNSLPFGVKRVRVGDHFVTPRVAHQEEFHATQAMAVDGRGLGAQRRPRAGAKQPAQEPRTGHPGGAVHRGDQLRPRRRAADRRRQGQAARRRRHRRHHAGQVDQDRDRQHQGRAGRPARRHGQGHRHQEDRHQPHVADGLLRRAHADHEERPGNDD